MGIGLRNLCGCSCKTRSRTGQPERAVPGTEGARRENRGQGWAKAGSFWELRSEDALGVLGVV